MVKKILKLPHTAYISSYFAGSLWRREEITPTFPEGTHWTYVCNHVRRVSVGPHDEVLVLLTPNCFFKIIFDIVLELIIMNIYFVYHLTKVLK